jgi:hypothetical protein
MKASLTLLGLFSQVRMKPVTSVRYFVGKTFGSVGGGGGALLPNPKVGAEPEQPPSARATKTIGKTVGEMVGKMVGKTRKAPRRA